MPARRILVLAAITLLILGLPVLFAVLALARVVFLPPVAHTRLIGFDGLHAVQFCSDGDNMIPLQAGFYFDLWIVH
jgi:hypothetical protein